MTAPIENELPQELRLFCGKGGGIESWLAQPVPSRVIERINQIEHTPLSFKQLNQLLILSHEAGLSRGFFEYYWISDMLDQHPYDLTKLRYYPGKNLDKCDRITSINHLVFGLERIYIDSLLFFGNIRQGYRELRSRSFQDLCKFFRSRCFDAGALASRGHTLPLNNISRDERYLIGEMACKTYEGTALGELKRHLKDRFDQLRAEGGSRRITTRSLLQPSESSGTSRDDDPQYAFDLQHTEVPLSEMIDEEISDDAHLDARLDELAKKFSVARGHAIENTKLYLSIVDDLDIYVATSMRTRDDFRNVADTCSKIFDHNILEKYNIRFFDPTLSATASHEDKGLLECLMVKSAKVLLYIAGESDSYGKAAEAAIALSLGKPTIFFCEKASRAKLFRDIHPLSRLVELKTGVAVGAIISEDSSELPIIIDRILSNNMQYELQQKSDGYFIIKDKLTSSVIRVQTNDRMIMETFWNYYHSREDIL